MEDISVLYLVVVLLAVALVFITVWSRKGDVMKWFAVTASAVLVSTLFYGYGDLLGKPKPVSLEFLRSSPEAVVLRSVMMEGEAIYFYLLLPNERKPFSLSIPWSVELAKQLMEAQGSMGEEDNLIMRNPFQHSMDTRKPKFYSIPQPKLPLKKEPSRALEYGA